MNISKLEILITGGGGGIGRHLVDRLSPQVKRIAVFERDPSLCAELQNEYANVRCYPCDVTDHQALIEAIDILNCDAFYADVLINNAGLIHSEPLINVLSKKGRVHSLETWHKVIGANLHSVFNITGLIVDIMVAQRKKGIVINISSVSAKGNAGQSAYSAAKAGVNALTRTWAKELGVLGLRFVAIAPGFIDTPSTREALSEHILTKLKQQIPLRRLGEVENVYQAVRFIIENDYLNGTVIDVDGGLVI
jgi:3-oxoacyl-[acyl-carrier protein] reductase